MSADFRRAGYRLSPSGDRRRRAMASLMFRHRLNFPAPRRYQRGHRRVSLCDFALADANTPEILSAPHASLV